MGLVVPVKQIITELFVRGRIGQIKSPKDAQIFCPDLKWIEKFCKYLQRRNIQRPYRKESYDCDDYALDAMVQATEALCASNEIKDCTHSVSYAEVLLVPDGMRLYYSLFFGIDRTDLTSSVSAHALDFVRCANGKWYGIEPHANRPIDLDTLWPTFDWCIYVWL
jgi:hypothetical protein